jgi:hypothetical protein
MPSNGQSNALDQASANTLDRKLTELAGVELPFGARGAISDRTNNFGPYAGEIPSYWLNPPTGLAPKDGLGNQLEREQYGPLDGEQYPETFNEQNTLQDFLDQFVPEEGDVYEFHQDDNDADVPEEEFLGDDEKPIGPFQQRMKRNRGTTGESGLDQTGSDKDLTTGGIDPGAAMAKSGTYLDGENKQSETLTTEKDLTERPGPEGNFRPQLEAIYGTIIQYHKGQDYRISNTSEKPDNPEDSVVNECKDKGFELKRFADGYYKNHVRSALSGNPVRTETGGFVFTRGPAVPGTISGYTGE